MKRRLLVVLAFVGLPLTAAAQRITITPTVGVYRPLTDQGRWVFPSCSTVPPPCRFDFVRHALAPALSTGVKVALMGDRAGIEASVLTTATRRRHERSVFSDREALQVIDAAKAPARTTMAGLRFLLRVPLRPGIVTTFGTGPSFTLLSHADFDTRVDSPWRVAQSSAVSDMSIVGLTHSAGLEVTISRRARFEIVVTDYTYEVQSSGYDRYLAGLRVGIRQQHDLVVSAGFGLVPLP